MVTYKIRFYCMNREIKYLECKNYGEIGGIIQHVLNSPDWEFDPNDFNNKIAFIIERCVS